MNFTRKLLPRAYAAAVLLIAALTLTACGNAASHRGAPSSPSPSRASPSAPSSSSAPTGTPTPTTGDAPLRPQALGQQGGQYPWMIRLQHSGDADGAILATYTSFEGDRAEDPIFSSTDQGRTFTRIGALAPGASSNNLCCTNLFELPRRVGALPPGTLLWAGAENAHARPMSLPVWRSEDHGHTWSYLSTCYTSPNNGGVWEPELSMDDLGELNCYFSDESDPAHSQTLVRTVSLDGVHWGAKEPVVALPDRNARPGMAVVHRLPSGQYFMTYELCGTPGPRCAVHYRRSPDGRAWGDPATPGVPVVGPHGQIPEHTPKFTVTPDGRILLASMVLVNPDGSPAPGDGSVLLVNSSAGAGPWSVIPAPVTARRVSGCTNYSPALLPTGTGGGQVLEITTRQLGPTCTALYGIGESSP
jgi:hypothetical protein